MSGGNGRGNMRPASRSPPFLVVGLLIAMGILAINYWSTSSKNKDLYNQLDSLQVDFRAVSDKHLAVEKRASDLSSQSAEFQSMVTKLQTSATEKDDKVNLLTDELNSMRSLLGQAQQGKSEGESRIQEMLNEKKSVVGELERVKTELQDERKRVAVCDERACCGDVLREVMKVMLDSVGKSKVIAALSPSHADLLTLIDDLVKGASDPPVQQIQENPQHPQPSNQDNIQQPGGQGSVTVPGREPSQNPNMAQNANMGQNPNMAQNPNMGQNPDMAQNPNMGQNPNMAQNPNMGQNPNLGQDLKEAVIPAVDQVRDAAQNAVLGQRLPGGQNPNLGINPNVVEMQQPQQQQQQPQQPQQQQPGSQSEITTGQDNQNPPQQDLLGVLKLPLQNHPQNIALQTERSDAQANEEGGKQEIVAQNILRREGGEETALSNDDRRNHQLHDLNVAAPAQEDVGDNGHMDLPEDEMDRQAKANHGAGDLGSLDDIHDQLQDLSNNQPAEIRDNRNVGGEEEREGVVHRLGVNADPDKALEERRGVRREGNEQDQGSFKETLKEDLPESASEEENAAEELPNQQEGNGSNFAAAVESQEQEDDDDDTIPTEQEMPEEQYEEEDWWEQSTPVVSTSVLTEEDGFKPLSPVVPDEEVVGEEEEEKEEEEEAEKEYTQILQHTSIESTSTTHASDRYELEH